MYSILNVLGLDLPDLDYSKPLEEIFTRTVKCWIKERQSLDIIPLATRSLVRQHLPSWVLDWTNQGSIPNLWVDNISFIYFSYDDIAQHGRASKRSRAVILDSDQSQKLTVQGCRVGYITFQNHQLLENGSNDVLSAFVSAFKIWCASVDDMRSLSTEVSNPMTMLWSSY